MSAKPEQRKPDETRECGRRRFLLGAGAAAVALGPGLFLVVGAEARPPGEAASPRQRWGLLIDVSRCTADCDRCVAACRDEFGWGEGAHADAAQRPEWIRKVEATPQGGGATRSLPVMCQHCAKPACADVCPTGASFKRADGIVLVDRHLCIGCRYCIMACPFSARFFVHEDIANQRAYAPRGKGTAEGCTLCVHRVDAGRQPACVEACQASGGAMIFGDLNDPASAIAKALAAHASQSLRPNLDADPGVRYANL